MFGFSLTLESRVGSITRVLSRSLLPALGVLLCTITTSTAHDSDALEQFLGVWRGQGVVLNQAGQTVTEVRNIDIALWPSENGYEMSWSNLDQNQAPRAMIHFAEPGEHNSTGISWTNPAEGTKVTLQHKGSRLTVILSGETPKPDSLARYDYTLLDDGQIVLQYSLSQDDETLVRLTAQLYRAKVVM